MSWFPSAEGILVATGVMTLARAVWIWRKFDDHRFLRFIGWPEPYDRTGELKYYWSSGVSRAEVERALSPEYAAKYGWLMTPRARHWIITANVLSWTLVIYGGFDLPGGLGMSNGHLSWWGILPLATWWSARASARVIADAPDELLDERLIAIRNAAYLEAYRLLGMLISAGAVVGIALDIWITDSMRQFGSADWTSLTVTIPFVLIWAYSTMPSLVIIGRQSSKEF